jgi:uncharacterized CHY-type Zn-finger protein
MSIETWKKEFYPKKPTERMSKKTAIQHSLKKWIGLRPENLKKHQLQYTNAKDLKDEDGNMFFVNSDSCSLCIKYLNFAASISCQKCPLYKSLDNHPCDNWNQPYFQFMDNNDPEPMIVALKETLAENT